MSELLLPRGVLTPLVTPFKSGEIDFACFADLIERQFAAGIDGIIVGDQTGEGLTLAADERNSLVTMALELARDRVPVVAAVGSNCTEGTNQDIGGLPDGISALLVTVPYYSKPTAKGIIHHFRQIARMTHLPVIIDDDPKRTARPLTSDILEGLRGVETIRGVRHCGSDVAGFVMMAPALKRHYRHYAGDDRTAPAYLMAGASALSSPIANLYPERVRSFFDLAQIHHGLGEVTQHRKIEQAIAALGDSDPENLKYALSIMTNCREEVRLPLLPPDEDGQLKIAEFMTRQQLCKDGLIHDRVVSLSCRNR